MSTRKPSTTRPTAGSWSWCAWMGPDVPPIALGRDQNDALERLRARLVAFYRDEAETPCPDPQARAEAELVHYRSSGFLCFLSPDEAAGFAIWTRISNLSPDEALRRWREVFPSAARVDPLRPEHPPTAAERVARIEADPRYEVLGATVARLPHTSPRRMARYKDLAAQPTSG